MGSRFYSGLEKDVSGKSKQEKMEVFWKMKNKILWPINLMKNIYNLNHSACFVFYFLSFFKLLFFSSNSTRKGFWHEKKYKITIKLFCFSTFFSQQRADYAPFHFCNHSHLNRFLFSPLFPIPFANKIVMARKRIFTEKCNWDIK